MELYKSKYLTINKKHDTLIQEWSSKELTPLTFKNEILIFLDIYEKHKPNAVLWNQEHFSFKFKPEHLKWFDKDVLKNDNVNGMRNVAITVAKNEEIHLSLVELLRNSDSLIQPHYFSNLNAAKSYLETGYNKELYNPETINYKIISNGSNHGILVHVGNNDLPQALDALTLLKNHKIFAKKNKEKFELLTVKELEIFKLIVLGNTNKIIGTMLFIEVSTVATHRKHILKKLGASSYKDLYTFAKAFRIVKF